MISDCQMSQLNFLILPHYFATFVNKMRDDKMGSTLLRYKYSAILFDQHLLPNNIYKT